MSETKRKPGPWDDEFWEAFYAKPGRNVGCVILLGLLTLGFFCFVWWLIAIGFIGLD